MTVVLIAYAIDNTAHNGPEESKSRQTEFNKEAP